MKEIKFLLLVLVIASYTSLFWVTVLTDWLVFTEINVGRAGLHISSIVILIMTVSYIIDHWKDN